MKGSSFGLAFPALILGRLLLSLVPLPNALRVDHLLSSPMTSYRRLREGVYLFDNDIDPYSGGVFRHSPLYLALFSTLVPNLRWATAVLWTLCDALGAWALVQIFRARQGLRSSSRDTLIASMYLLNPYIFFPSLALSTSSIDNTLTLLSVMFACQGKVSPALLAHAFLLHSSPSSILILAPTILLLLTSPNSKLASPSAHTADLRKALPLLFELVVYFVFLTSVSALAAGGWSWVGATWGAVLTLPDLAPNTGMWWYFFTEMFDHFRPFFLMVFSVHLLIYIIPICIKFQYDALYATFILVGVLGTFKAYPTFSDPGLFLSMISVFPETYPYLRHPIVTSLLHLHAFLLLPLFKYLWLTQGTGNANFFYASTLVFCCANGAAVVDMVWGGLRIAVGDVGAGSVVQE